MPILKIVTNLPKANIPKDFVDKIIPTLAKSVNKPESKFICVITSDANMCMFGNSSTPGVVASLESIGNLGVDKNHLISKELSQFIEKELGVQPNRFLVTFYDLEAHNVGVAGTTVNNIGK
ncbi:MIF-like protein mif-2 [Pectinophora gossypiella]|uniref:MIF-like protein mif-2 n=1 Tax=Pectinophora gossypiella TaxID=13191 RepID=UPI00214F5D0E|nr:MIF-like protein mif-2 [Pectinophora gossypiella]